MSTIKRAANPEQDPRVKAVFDDIRATRGKDYINNLWHYLAFDPALLEETWRDVKAVMAQPTLLDPKTKEMIYLAVSITNACPYCIHTHTVAARTKGMTDPEHAELLRIVALAARMNHLLNGMQIPVDEIFNADAK